MSKEKRIYLITATILVVLYIVSAVFTLGQVFTPNSYWGVLTVSEDKDSSLASASVLIDLDLEKKVMTEEDKEVTKTVGVSEIYVFIGSVHSPSKSDEGEYVTLRFHFKSTSKNDVEVIKRSVEKKIPVIYSTGGFKWIKVFDADESKQYPITDKRVKISSPDSLDLHEVVFIDEDGEIIKASVASTTATEDQLTYTPVVIDEQDTFKNSQSKKYNLTDEELKSLAAVKSLQGGNSEVGIAPLDTLLDFVAVTIFKSPFSVRIFDCIAGLGILLLAYSFVFKLFKKWRSSLIALISCLALGSVFTASGFSFGLVSAFFGLLSLYLATNFFIGNYYYEEEKSSILNIILIGLSFGLAVSVNMVYCLILLPIVVLVVMAGRRAYKRYKKDEKEAVGLNKEEVFLAYRRKRVLTWLLSIASFTVLPTLIFTVFYSCVARVYKDYYGLNYFASAVAHFKGSFSAVYHSNPLALLIGFGSVKVGNYYSFLNLFICSLALISFIFVSVAVLFGNKIKFFERVKKVSNKYKIITTCFVGSFIPVVFGLTASPWGFALTSVFYSSYIAFAEQVLSACIKPKKAKIIFNICLIVGLIIFAMGYVGYAGIELPQLAEKILYLWQVR